MTELLWGPTVLICLPDLRSDGRLWIVSSTSPGFGEILVATFGEANGGFPCQVLWAWPTTCNLQAAVTAVALKDTCPRWPESWPFPSFLLGHMLEKLQENEAEREKREAAKITVFASNSLHSTLLPPKGKWSRITRRVVYTC